MVVLGLTIFTWAQQKIDGNPDHVGDGGFNWVGKVSVAVGVVKDLHGQQLYMMWGVQLQWF